METARDAFNRLAALFNRGLATAAELQEAYESMGYAVPEVTEVAIRRGELIVVDNGGAVRAIPEGTLMVEPRHIIGVALDNDHVLMQGNITTEDIEQAHRDIELSSGRQADTVIVDEATAREIFASYRASFCFAPSLAASTAYVANRFPRAAEELLLQGYSRREIATMLGVDLTTLQPRQNRYQYTEKFPARVRNRAWDFLKNHMTETQHFAFMEGEYIEIGSKVGDYRLLIRRNGEFTMLRGGQGEGIVVLNGQKQNRIKSYNYPLGDEIAAFIDWFRYKPEELISQWNCGAYGIVTKGQRR